MSKIPQDQKTIIFDPFQWHLDMTFFFAQETNETKKCESPKFFVILLMNTRENPLGFVVSFSFFAVPG
jgi:hypothetical protein